MPRPKPPPRTLAPEDERKIQIFLERAAPIVLVCPVLDRATWESLSELATELELTEDQLRETVEDLRQRGVIEKIDIRPPKPPPLPNRPLADQDSVGEDTTEFEEEFLLSAPPPLPNSSQRKSATRSVDSSPVAPSPTHDLPKLSQPDRFAERAREIITEHRGLGPKSQSLLMAAAEEFGVSNDEFREVLRGEFAATPELPPRSELPVDSDDDDESAMRRRWRVAGQPAPEPAPTKKRPQEVFQAYVDQSLEKCVDGEVPTELEERVIKHGVRVLKLARVFAQHILNDSAEGRQLRLKSQPAEREAEADLSPAEEKFRDHVASILAKHRGINDKSRVLLSALAREMGFSTEQIDAAVASLQRRSSAAESHEARMQAERLAAFRRHVEAALGKLPRGILLPNSNDLLIEQGSERYGLKTDFAQAAVREAAAARNLSVISNEQATQHIDELVDQMLGDGLRLSPEMRQRVFAEASQWGLVAEDAEKIIQARSRQNYRRKRSEQQLANTALMAGACAITLVIAFIGWTLMVGVTPEPEIEPESDIAARLTEIAPGPDRDDSWWSRDLSVALAKCRLNFRELRPTLDSIRSTIPAERALAYERIVDQLFRLDDDDPRRALFLEALSQCYALDPDDDAVDRLAAALLDSVPGPGERLDTNPRFYLNAFWGLRVAVASLTEAAASSDDRAPERADRLAASIEQVVGKTVDARQPPGELARACSGALAEHLFRLLIVAVESRPAMGIDLHRVIAYEALKYLDRALVDRLNADYLVAVLEQSTSQWREYQPLIQQAIESADPLAVAKLVGLFELTGDDQLRGFMEPLLRLRTDVRPQPQAVPELAEAFRKSLGIRSDSTLVGRRRIYARLADSVIADARTSAAEPDQILRETAQLAWLATLGFALLHDERGEELFRRLATEPNEIKGRFDSPRDADTSGIDSESRVGRTVRGYVKRLSNTNWFSRASQVGFLSKASDSIPDISLSDAQRLADYLVGLRPGDEREFVIKEVSELGKWKQLRLAVADHIARSKPPVDQSRELVEKLLERTIESPGLTVVSNERLEFELLQSTLESSSAVDAAAGETSLLDACRLAIAEHYLHQLQLLGVSDPPPEERHWPAALLARMIIAQAGQLRRTDLTHATRQQLDMLPHQIQAINYYARDALHRTALLERLWLDLLVVLASTQDAALGGEAEDVAEGLRERDRETSGMLVQLRDGHRAIVEIWLLINRAGRRSQ